mgnify:CR=1 FL=1
MTSDVQITCDQARDSDSFAEEKQNTFRLTAFKGNHKQTQNFSQAVARYIKNPTHKITSIENSGTQAIFVSFARC